MTPQTTRENGVVGGRACGATAALESGSHQHHGPIALTEETAAPRMPASSMWPSPMVAGWVFVPLVGLVFVVCGFLLLLWLIPRLSGDTQVRTDVYSARASYWMVAVGLLLTIFWAVSALVVGSLAMAETLRPRH